MAGATVVPDVVRFFFFTAVTTDLQRTFVIRLRQGKAEWVDVKTGITVSGKTEVFRELRAEVTS